jgi:hypothetical protein
MRDAQLRALNQSGVEEITVVGLPSRFGVAELQESPDHWVNRCNGGVLPHPPTARPQSQAGDKKCPTALLIKPWGFWFQAARSNSLGEEGFDLLQRELQGGNHR